MKTRIPPPEILAGNRQQTKRLIDSLDFRWKYTSGVIAFAPTDDPSDEDIRKIMEDFEAIAFAGLDADRRDILWVKHSHEGQPELHFVIPRVDLLTGKSLNVAPPGWEKFFDPLRDYWNYKKSWARPDDLARARLCQPGHVALQQAEHLRAGLPRIADPKEAITGYLMARIQAGIVADRNGIIDSLKEVVHEITRERPDYISVRLVPGDKPIRLRGAIYGSSFDPESIFRSTEAENGGRASGHREFDEDRARDASERFEEGIRRRADYNRHRYQEGRRRLGEGNPEDAPGADRSGGSLEPAVEDGGFHPLGGGVEPLFGYLTRKLGPDAIPGGGDHPAATGSGGPGGEGREGDGDRLRGDSAPLREDRPGSAGVPRWISGIGELLNSLGNENDGVGKEVIGSLRKIIHAIRNGHEAARRSSQVLGESSELVERAIGTAGMIDGVSHGNQNKLK
jgi:hypothetical protein